ncbi:MAG: 50S ribosomal protein L11 methyltransferase [Solirubrobacterales bacterium]
MIRLAVRCRPELAEVVLAELLVLAPGGVEEETGSGYHEYAIYGAPGELPELGVIKASVGDQLITVSSTELPDDWAERWADFHEPVLVAGRLWVRPSWEPAAAEGLIDLVIDPGQAFGTGAHPTTRLCIELLAELAAAGHASGSLVDWGTGSGVLAIAAAKLGFSPVIGADHEVASIEAAAANAAVNSVELELIQVNIRADPPPAAATAIANLTAPLLTEVAGALAAGETEAPETLVCSGILLDELTGVAVAMSAAGLEERDRRTEGDWGALLLSR